MSYERRGLVSPQRTGGSTRRLQRERPGPVRRITRLLEAGLNLAGIAMVLDLEADNARLRASLEND